MEISNTQSSYVYPSAIWRFYTVLGLLPWTQETRHRGQIKPGFWMLGYIFMLLIIFNICFSINFFFDDHQTLSHDVSVGFSKIFWIIGRVRSLSLAVTYNAILLSTNIQTWGKKLDGVIHNLRDFDIRYKGEPLVIETKPTNLLWVVTILTIIDFIRQGTGMHKTNVLSRICVICVMELFSVLVTNIKLRYSKLNEKLMKHLYLKKPLVIKFSDRCFEYLHNEDISMIRETRFLHKLLGTTVELTNSLMGPQMLCCYIMCLQEAYFIPCFCVLSFKKYYRKFNLDTITSLLTIFPHFFLFVQMISTVYNAHSTGEEARKTLKTVLYILNNQELQSAWEKEFKSLSRQLPLQVEHFRILELFELKPPLLINWLSVFSAYCLILVQLYG